jgi:LCP family protein required for cell wall assembly
MKRLSIAVVILLALSTGAAAAVAHHGELRRGYLKDGLLTVLVIGSDVGPPLRPGDPMRGRADAIHLVAVDTRARRATIVDFPRDAFVGGRKINGHLASGGPARLEAAVEGDTGIPVDFWALGTFRSLENLVAGIGGLDVVVDAPMKDPFSGSDFAAGPQRMTGPQALAFTRDRMSVPGGDFGRTRNQGSVLRFAHAQIRRSHRTLPELVRLAGLFARNTATNIPPTELLPLAMLAADIPAANVRQIALGGTAVMRRGASTVLLAPGATFADIRQGRVGP